jgi:gamma-glutamyltranspeptidase / glutathione hydrolase
MRAIATGGAEALRRGPIAEAILAAARDSDVNPAVMTTADLAGYRAKERPPVCVGYRAYKVCGMGPPSSGGLTVGQILGLLSGFDLAASGPGPASVHLFAEASRLAYADRAQYMADPDFVSVPARGLLDPDYLASRAARIDRARSMGKATAGLPPWREGRLLAPDRQEELPGTSHFVVRDAAGNAVSMTTTVESAFGSGLMAAGFILNNELTDFSFRPEEDGRPVANRVAGGKRPRSSMAPTIVFRDGAPYLLIGSPGGSQIIGYVAWATIGVLDFGLDPQAAIDMGHVANQNGATGLEAGTAAAAWADQLGALGHEVQERPFESGLQAILIRSDGSLVGGVDRRREGTVAGR